MPAISGISGLAKAILCSVFDETRSRPVDSSVTEWDRTVQELETAGYATLRQSTLTITRRGRFAAEQVFQAEL